VSRAIAKVVIGPDPYGSRPYYEALVAYDADYDVVFDISLPARRGKHTRIQWVRAARRRLRGQLPYGWWDKVTSRPYGFSWDSGAVFEVRS
jgi:hypothetical protein